MSGASVSFSSLVAWVTLDYRAQQRMLAELEAQGVTRRSEPTRAKRAIEQIKEQAKEKA